MKGNLSMLALFKLLSIAVILALGVGGFAVAAEEQPSGTVEIDDEQLRFILGGEVGKVILHYQGKQYHFKIAGLTAGGFGVSKVNAQGNVYHLKNPADLAGRYSEASAGITIVKGKGGVVLENEKGVVLKLFSHSEGVELAIGAGGLVVQPK
jgi:hypothetical protein